jgi:hypothetical protein
MTDEKESTQKKLRETWVRKQLEEMEDKREIRLKRQRNNGKESTTQTKDERESTVEDRLSRSSNIGSIQTT